MKTLEHHNVKIFTDNIEESALEQIKQLMEVDVFKDCKVRIMPDVHAGAGCVIGFTGDLGDKVIPNIVGVDIGCGMIVQPFKCVKPIEYHRLNEFITQMIPSGREVRSDKTATLTEDCMDGYRKAKEMVKQLHCIRDIKDSKRLYKSIGTLGGGNHFIEIDKDENGLYYIVVHTGSRNLGKQVAEIYQSLAIKNQSGWDKLMIQQKELIAEYKATGRKTEIQDAIRALHQSFVMRKPPIPVALCYLQGESREEYLHDMRICQEWAKINRRMIAHLLVKHLQEQGCIGEDCETLEKNVFESVHNYIGDDNIIRKGSISARKGEKCIIPLNMRDGSLICVGKGNEDWNFSAPHGAGRRLSRKSAFEQIKLEDFKLSMEGIYSETVNENTKDESPMAYKPSEEIIANIGDTVEILNIIKPTFNFKACI